jgi:predicted ATPase
MANRTRRGGFLRWIELDEPDAGPSGRRRGGVNAEGGTVNFRFVTRSGESTLGRHRRLVRGIGKHRTGFFVRTESFYNVLQRGDRDRQARRGQVLRRTHRRRRPGENSASRTQPGT